MLLLRSISKLVLNNVNQESIQAENLVVRLKLNIIRMERNVINRFFCAFPNVLYISLNSTH